MGLEFSFDSKSVDEFLELAPKKTALAILRSVKRGTTAAGTKAARVVASDMALKVGDARKAIRIVPPNYETLTGEVRAKLKRIPLIKFNARGPQPSRGKGRGVSYRAEGTRKTISSAFIETMPGGHQGVFKRAPGRSRRGGPPHHSELPIRELFGPSVGHVFHRHRDEIEKHGLDVTQREINRQLDLILGVRAA